MWLVAFDNSKRQASRQVASASWKRSSTTKSPARGGAALAVEVTHWARASTAGRRRLTSKPSDAAVTSQIMLKAAVAA